jgi:hypothetical protein
MSRQLRRIERLAQMVGSDIKRRRLAEREWQIAPLRAVQQAALLAFIIQVGDPRVDEALSVAWQRCKETETWARCCREFPVLLCQRHGTFPIKPHDKRSASAIGAALRHFMSGELSAIEEKAKLNAMFAAAPPWLLWFAFGDYTAKLLDLSLPDLSGVRGFERSRVDFERWPGLPEGVFERRPWPNGPEGEPLAQTDLKLLGQPMGPDLRDMSPRQRKRALETYMKPQQYEQTWPSPAPIEFLKDPVEFAIRQAN